MNRLNIEKMAGLTTFSILTAFSLKAAEPKKPNIIYILTDDQEYALLGCTGNKLVHTPNIDRLAKEGVLFTNFHVSSAISTPSRTCMLTGRYERSHGVNFNSGTSLSDEAWQDCYPMHLRRNGYYTGYVGKNHTPIGRGGYTSGLMEKSYDYWYAGHRHLKFYSKEWQPIFKYAQYDTQVEIINEGALDFLKTSDRQLQGPITNARSKEEAIRFLNARPKDMPFFLNVCFNLPHGAGTSNMQQRPSDDEIYKTLYRDIDIPLPEHYIAKADIKKQKMPHSVFHPEDRQSIYDYVDTPAKLKERIIREMEAMTGIDRLVGNLMVELKKQHIEKNTIIMFCSDHGIFKGEYGLGGKSLCYEKTTHVPFIIYDPRVKKSKRCCENNELVMEEDIAPTILEYAGIAKPKDYQGFSVVPLLNHEISKLRDYAYTENLWSTHFGNPRCESIQNKEWKYIRYYHNNNQSAIQEMKHYKELGMNNSALYKVSNSDAEKYRIYIDAGLNGEKPVYEELFNLKNDPMESTNLINDSQYKEILDTLRSECQKALVYARGKGAPKVYLWTETTQVEPN